MQSKFPCGVIVAGAMLAGTISSAVAAPLDMKTGLWEMSLRSESHGHLPVPPEILQRLSPERRAALEKQMARNNQPHTHTYKTCITQQKLDKGEDSFLSGEPGMKCDNKFSRHTRTSVAGTFHCTKAAMQQTGDFTYEIKDREHVAGKMNISVSNGIHTMTSKADMSGRWLGASCGDTP